MGRANGERPDGLSLEALKALLLSLESDAVAQDRVASLAEEQARNARQQAASARKRVDELRAVLEGRQETSRVPVQNAGQHEPKTTWDSIESDLCEHTRTNLGHNSFLERTIRAAVRSAAILIAQGNHALIPYAECLEAAGISRDVGDRLREEGELEPIVIAESKNPRLYISVGAWRAFVKRRKLALPPSQSKLSKAKRKTKAK